MSTKKNHKNKIGVYLLPSIITTIGVFFGFYSIIQSISGNFKIAAITIIFAAFFDALDGRVARLTKTQSDFGAQYDSMADLVSFGVAPAILIYKWNLYDFGVVGLMFISIYLIFTILRLARFNVQSNLIKDMTYFQGLPSPASAILIACIVYLDVFLLEQYQYLLIQNNIITILLASICSLLMVSNIKYSNFHNINLKEKISFKLALIIPLILSFIALSFIAYNPILFLSLMIFLYILSGPLITIIKILKLKSIDKKQKKYS